MSGHAEDAPVVEAEMARPLVERKPPAGRQTYRRRFMVMFVALARRAASVP